MTIAILGGGCFWCLDAPFRKLKGVLEVTSGYTGGVIENPSYQQICSGLTEHAEVVKITFDEAVISYSSLLEAFFHLHDPTQLNRQGNDIGTQYRSVIYFQDAVQKLAAMKMKASIAAQLCQPVVTEISQQATFYPAEQYHQDYYNNNPSQPYCSMLIGPKLAHFEQQFAHLIK